MITTYYSSSGDVPDVSTCLLEADYNVDANSISTEFVHVPYYDVHVPCGSPDDIGFVEDGEYIYLPKLALGNVNGTICVSAKGESMIDAGIKDGDTLAVKLTNDVHDGNIVVALINGEVTCKVLYRPSVGRLMLIPCNKRYKPFVFDENSYDEVKILGVVTGVTHHLKDIPFYLCADMAEFYARELEQKDAKKPAVPSEETVKKALCQINPLVDIGRKWFAVMRILIDCGYYKSGDYRNFIDDLQTCLGNDLNTLPTVQELSRMCVQSFSKSYERWDRNNAPVKGKRYEDYYNLAARFKEMID